MLRNWPCKQLGAFLRSLAVFVLVQVAAPLIAQTSTGVVRGTVSDESGRAVANASVTATSIDTGQKQTANTGPDGTYKLELPAGNYRLTFEATGFKTFEIFQQRSARPCQKFWMANWRKANKSMANQRQPNRKTYRMRRRVARPLPRFQI